LTTWISRRPVEAVRADVEATDTTLPLAGQTLAVKDNIDVVGLATTAGCPSFAYEPTASAPVVARLVAAGAVVAGKTNLDQFATGLVGTRSPYGAAVNPLVPDRVSGGSSSGSAVAVATGEVDLALGTDTAGSGRVPAAFCGIVGLKPTRGWLSTRGVVPACRSLDCVSVFGRDVAGSAAAVEIAAGFDPEDPWSRRRPTEVPGRVLRLGVPTTEVLARWCSPAVVEAFFQLPFDAVEVDLGPYLAAGDLLYGGALVAERHAAVGAFIEAHPDSVDPVVAAIIRAAGNLSASALAADLDRLAMLRRRAEDLWSVVDAVVVPTAPHHPTLAEVAADPLGANAALGRFTNGCNLLDWCAAAVPVGTLRDGLPFGISVLGPAWSDRAVWKAAATIVGLSPPAPAAEAHDGPIALAVAGAHLEGQPLNHQLTSRGARLLERTTTAACYRMVRLDTTPAKPGVLRVPEGGASLEVEVWELTPAAFGRFVAEVPPPLAIGTVELVDGTEVAGFVCEGFAVEGAEDITVHGGWRGWLAS